MQMMHSCFICIGVLCYLCLSNSEIQQHAGRSASHSKDLWRYRELFAILAWRDVTVRYRQTVIGVAWALIRPFLTMLVFSALLPWQFFSTALSSCSESWYARWCRTIQTKRVRAIEALLASASVRSGASSASGSSRRTGAPASLVLFLVLRWTLQ
ncbi:hypothetical protein [Synechococcus sp. CBW1107]|uniref:hypothetical protein n=1 Tax=Synechococcus sp. CBW1107 TaxID=2789857 RepID=UPI002AD27C40|nr:hypothetical protein [Synechococcus sp. CBW1107]CAK6697192.1 hypothetical protein IFHNHDMJ_02177 [Synechococcus sp. CBW1107]